MERTLEKVVLEFTVSIRRNKIDVQGTLMHPAVFLLKEEIDSKSMGNASEKDIIEASPAFINILNFSSRRNAYYKFFDAKNDINLVKEGDYFIYFGEKGKNFASWLKSLGHKIILVGIGDLDNL